MKIKNLLAVIGMTVSFTITTFADSPSTGGGGGNGSSEECNPIIPDRLPIGDAVDFQANAWERVAQIGISAWAQSVIRSTTDFKSDEWIKYSPANGVDVNEIFGIIRQQQLRLNVLYTSDTINMGVGLYDAEGNNLLHGHSSAGINPPQGGVSRNTLGIVLEMNSESRIPIAGARWFEIIERNKAGNPIRYYSSEYPVQDAIIFPGYFANKLGEVRIGLCNGTEVAYALNGGTKLPTTQVDIGIGNVSALGTRTFSDTNIVFVEVSQEEEERNINPLSQLSTFTSGCTGTSGFSVTTGQPCGERHTRVILMALRRDRNTGQILEFASEVSVRRQGQLPDNYAINPVDKAIALNLERARYWVKFRFPSGWPHGKNQFEPPYDGPRTPTIEP